MNNKLMLTGKHELDFQESQDLELEITDNLNLTINIKSTSKLNIKTVYDNESSKEINMVINVHDGSTFNLNNIDFGVGNNNVYITVNLCSKAQANVYSIIYGDNVESKYNIKMINNGEKSIGVIEQKALVKNGGKVTLKATGKINKNSPNSENFQESKILLLDQSCFGEVSPLLLINNNEVKAAHTADISKVDPESLYYLQTRGIGQKEAEKLLTQAFVKSIIEKMNMSEKEKDQIKGEFDV